MEILSFALTEHSLDLFSAQNVSYNEEKSHPPVGVGVCACERSASLFPVSSTNELATTKNWSFDHKRLLAWKGSDRREQYELWGYPAVFSKRACPSKQTKQIKKLEHYDESWLGREYCAHDI